MIATLVQNIFAVIGVIVAVLFVGALIAGFFVKCAIAEVLEQDKEEAESPTARDYSKRRRQKARSRGATAARQGLPPSMCPYKTKDEEPLRQEWLTGHVMVRMKKLRPETSEALPVGCFKGLDGEPLSPAIGPTELLMDRRLRR